MDWEAAISAALVLLAQLGAGVLKDETLTDEEKIKYIDRINAAQVKVPEWK